MSEPRKPMLVRCDAPSRDPNRRTCGHVWAIAWLPMEAEICAKVLHSARCPMCGNGPKQIFLASKDDAAKFAGGGAFMAEGAGS